MAEYKEVTDRQYLLMLADLLDNAKRVHCQCLMANESVEGAWRVEMSSELADQIAERLREIAGRMVEVSISQEATQDARTDG